MQTSILDTIKKTLGLNVEDTSFDTDVVLHTNTALMTLTQVGVGPTEGFSIGDRSAVWSDFLGSAKDLEATKSYMALKVRLMFDPPTSSFVIDSINRQLDEIIWRLNVNTTVPTPDPVVEDDDI